MRIADHFKGFDKLGYIGIYTRYLKKAGNNETVNNGVAVLEAIARDKSVNKWVSYAAKKSIKDLATMYDDRERLASNKLKTTKESNASAEIMELERQIENAKVQKQRLADIYNKLIEDTK